MTTSVTGKVTRLYVDGDTCFIRIAYNQSSLGKPVPANNYFQLKKAADNYDAMYSLAMAAAFNDRALWIRAQNDIEQGQIALVGYLVVDF